MPRPANESRICRIILYGKSDTVPYVSEKFKT